MKHYFYYCLILLMLVPAGVSFAQSDETSAVSGYVKDATSGETLLLANVLIKGTITGGTTNTLGYYTINNLQPGTYTFVCSYIGYDVTEIEVTLAAGERKRLDILVEPTSIQLEELIVEDESYEEEAHDVGVSSMTTRMVTELPSVLQADVFRSLQLLPGVKSASDFSSGLYIRGGGPDQTLIMIDRTIVYNPSHFFGLFSTFNPDAIKDVRLYKGGFQAEYGGRLGAVLDVYNKDGNRNKYAGVLSLGLLSSRAAIEGPIGKKGSAMITVRRSTIEPVLAALKNSVDNLPESFYFYDINAKINYDPGQNDKLSFAYYTGRDDIVFPFASNATFNLNYGNTTLSANWTHIFSEKLFSNFTATKSVYSSLPEIEFGGTEFKRNNTVTDYSVKGDFEYIPNNNHVAKAGFWAGRLDISLRDEFDGQEGLTFNIVSDYAAFYLQEEWKPSPLFKAVVGLRTDYFSRGNYFTYDPRISLEYLPFANVRLQLAGGRYHQFLTLISNEAFSGFDLWLTAAENVAPAYGDQIVFGVKTEPWQGYNFDVEVYFRTMKDLFELDPFLQDASGLPYDELFRIGEGRAYGVEVFLQKNEGRFNGFIGYTWSRTERKFPRANFSNFYPPKHDRTHDLQMVANYNLGRNWKATAVFAYATGQAYTRPLGSFNVEHSPVGSRDRTALDIGNLNASRLPAYHRLDIGFTKTRPMFDKFDSEFQIQIINVYNHRNVWFYNFDFAENPVQQDVVQMLPILPNLAWTLRF